MAVMLPDKWSQLKLPSIGKADPAEQERLLKLFWNRAELKKELQDLDDQLQTSATSSSSRRTRTRAAHSSSNSSKSSWQPRARSRCARALRPQGPAWPAASSSRNLR
jgi:hypothetical protein